MYKYYRVPVLGKTFGCILINLELTAYPFLILAHKHLQIQRLDRNETFLTIQMLIDLDPELVVLIRNHHVQVGVVLSLNHRPQLPPSNEPSNMPLQLNYLFLSEGLRTRVEYLLLSIDLKLKFKMITYIEG
jgi:hypothetical protein